MTDKFLVLYIKFPNQGFSKKWALTDRLNKLITKLKNIVKSFEITLNSNLR